jgi:hypothetical protein
MCLTEIIYFKYTQTTRRVRALKTALSLPGILYTMSNARHFACWPGYKHSIDVHYYINLYRKRPDELKLTSVTVVTVNY